VLKAKQKL
jgi:hypothetical protein